ncbi:MAG: hypothetical protein F2646_05160, partial [Actinobacteria bacterium]|nr:hypothetical protein [Actinomycetota bacterium]
MAKKDKNSGVRGPSGPPQRGSTPTPKAKNSTGSSSGRSGLERKSFPILVMLHRVPRWLLV